MADRPDGPPRAILIGALSVAVLAVLAVVAVAAIHGRGEPQSPVAIAAVPAPAAGSPDCAKLLAALPNRLGDYDRATPADPAPPGTAAWQANSGGEPVVLRCGLDRPIDFVVGAPIQIVNAVQWFSVTDPASGPDNGRSTWFTVDRPVYVALTLPPGSGPTPIQQLSDVVDAALPATPINPGPPH